jgi:integrase/recombinase XerC
MVYIKGCNGIMLIESFLDYLRFERNYSDKTIVGYGNDIVQFWNFLQDGRSEEFEPSLVEADDIREWIVLLMDEGISPSSINRKLSSLRSFYKYLLKRGEVTKDPLRKVIGPKKKKPLPIFIKESDMDRILDETDFGDGFVRCRDRLIVGTFYATGMRLSELIGLNDGDVDFSSSQLKVTGKRNKQRLIPFGDELKHMMLEYVTTRNEQIPRITDAFFVKENGERLYEGLVYRIVKRNLSKVVTQKRSPHVLRHTFATTMLNHEAELGAIKELLGHRSLTTTEIYTHTTFEELKKVYKQAHPRA